MIGVNELLAKKAKYENEKIFLDAKIAVVNELIDEENAKCFEQPCETINDEPVEEIVEEQQEV